MISQALLPDFCCNELFCRQQLCNLHVQLHRSCQELERLKRGLVLLFHDSTLRGFQLMVFGVFDDCNTFNNNFVYFWKSFKNYCFSSFVFTSNNANFIAFLQTFEYFSYYFLRPNGHPEQFRGLSLC